MSCTSTVSDYSLMVFTFLFPVNSLVFSAHIYIANEGCVSVQPFPPQNGRTTCVTVWHDTPEVYAQFFAAQLS